MANVAVHVRGYRECISALNKVNREVSKETKAALKDAADPVAASSREKLARYQGASLGTIGPRVTTQGVFVTQRAKKVTGKRGDFGALQMTRGLMPALDEHGDEIEHGVVAAFDTLVRSSGFH